MKAGFPSACIQCKGKLERDGMVARCFACRLSYTSAGHMLSWKPGADPRRKTQERAAREGPPTVRFLTGDRGHPDMGGNNRGAHLLGKNGSASAWAPTDAEAKRRLVVAAREFAAALTAWADKQEAASK